MEQHYSVLLKETIDKLCIKKNGTYVDATLGFGGHTKEIAKVAHKVISFDQDINAINVTKKKLKTFKNITFINTNFENLEYELKKLNIQKIDGILFDLGTSLEQLTDEKRGFTYHGQSVLDMRMDQEQTMSAIDVINEYSRHSLEKIFFEFGDEKLAKKLASKIIEERKKNKITTNTQLNEIIKKVKGWNKKKHPSKNIFQAIRIEVNREIEVLKEGLKQAVKFLDFGATLVVITFHSLEDKIVKDFFYKLKQKEKITTFKNIKYFYTHKTIYPSEKEINENKASRSAKLRSITKNNE